MNSVLHFQDHVVQRTCCRCADTDFSLPLFNASESTKIDNLISIAVIGKDTEDVNQSLLEATCCWHPYCLLRRDDHTKYCYFHVEVKKCTLQGSLGIAPCLAAGAKSEAEVE